VRNIEGYYCLMILIVRGQPWCPTRCRDLGLSHKEEGMIFTLSSRTRKVYGVHIARNQSTLERHALSCMERRLAHLTNKEQEETTEKADSIATSNTSELNDEEISKLKSFLKTIQGGSCSLAQTCMLQL